MKKLFLLVAVAASFIGCTKESIQGTGSIVTETRTVHPFSRVRLEGSGEAIIHYGATQEVIVTGYENLVPIYETNVSNGTLQVKFQNNINNVRNNNIRVLITIPALNKVSINGSGSISLNNFNGASIGAEINGSGDIYSSNANYQLGMYTISGSGTIHGRGIVLNEADVYISGSGVVDVNCTDRLDASISGSGKINYWGNPVTVSTSISGSGRVVKR